MAEHYEVIVVGAGPAGTLAALRAREVGARSVAIIDKQPLTGGTCTNTGCVPTRVLAKMARLLRDIRGARDYGIKVSPPEVLWNETRDRVRRVIEDVHACKRDAEKLAAAGVSLFLNEPATFSAPHEILLNTSGKRLAAERFILCVGGRPRRLPIPGVEHTIYPADILNLNSLPRSTIIIGSGYTGVQLVTILNALGCAVTVLETQPEILPGADQDVGRHLAESFRQHDVVVETSVTEIERIAADSDQGERQLVYHKNGVAHRVESEAIILCAGWPAAIEDLGLEQAGVEAAGNYVAVNEYLQTSAPHIYVAGDASGRGLLVQAAHFEALVAAENAVQGPRRKIHHAMMPSGGFTDPDHAGVGLTENKARAEHPGCRVIRVNYTELERAIIDRRTGGFFKLIADPETQLILGAHAVGESAVEVIQAVATAMAANIKVAELSQVEFAYPTYTAIIGIAARRVLRN